MHGPPPLNPLAPIPPAPNPLAESPEPSPTVSSSPDPRPGRAPMTSRLLLTSLLFASGTACASKKAEPAAKKAAVLSVAPAEDGLTLQSIDINGDGRADVFNYVRERTGNSALVVRKETDLNWDGRVDVRAWFDDSGALTREEMDGDFDQRVDWVDHYQAGVRVMSEVDSNFDGVLDLFKYYEGGVLKRKERDTNNDGRIDMWEYFDPQGNVVKVGKDLDGDGVMDLREG